MATQVVGVGLVDLDAVGVLAREAGRPQATVQLAFAVLGVDDQRPRCRDIDAGQVAAAGGRARGDGHCEEALALLLAAGEEGERPAGDDPFRDPVDGLGVAREHGRDVDPSQRGRGVAHWPIPLGLGHVGHPVRVAQVVLGEVVPQRVDAVAADRGYGLPAHRATPFHRSRAISRSKSRAWMLATNDDQLALDAHRHGSTAGASASASSSGPARDALTRRCPGR